MHSICIRLANRLRQPPFFQRILHPLAVGAVLVLTALTAAGLIYKNRPLMASINSDLLSQYARLAADGLPQKDGWTGNGKGLPEIHLRPAKPYEGGGDTSGQAPGDGEAPFPDEEEGEGVRKEALHVPEQEIEEPRPEDGAQKDPREAIQEDGGPQAGLLEYRRP